MMAKFLAISFEEDGTAFQVEPSAKEAYAWLQGRNIDPGVVCGRQAIFEYTGELRSMDYDSYSESHVHSTEGEAVLVYDQDATTVNEDIYGLKEPS